MKRHSPAVHGSTLLYVTISMTILAAASATVLRPVSDEYMNTFRTASWQEALLGAESGIDLATTQLRQSLTRPGAAWPSPWVTGAGGVVTQSAAFSHAGEGGTIMQVSVTVDSPATLIDPVSGWQYYRIRSRGTNFVSGSRRAGGEKRDLDLRKLSLVRDRLTGAFQAQPSVSRTIEAVVRPSSAFPLALLSKGATTMTDHNVVVDSYDSSNPAKSTNGQWDPAKRQSHGDVATDGTLIAAGDAHIYGNVSTNGGAVTGVGNITGQIRADFYQDLPSINAPSWPSYTPMLVSGNGSVTASTIKGAARYKIPALSLSGNNTFSIKAPGGSGSPVSYVEIWVTGNVSFSGNASLAMDKNVIATIYVSGNMDIGGNGISNGNGTTDDRPANVMIYGLQPLPTVSQSVSLHGNADVEAGIYAPDADVTIVGGGSNGSFSGSVVAKTISMNGVTQVHYDENMAKTGVIVGYRIASWFEDSR